VRVKAGLIAAVAGFAVFATTAAASSPTAVGNANPGTVAPGRSTLLTVAVTPGAAPASTGVFVSCNLSSIGGDFSQMLVDDGTGDDVHAGDFVFSFRATVSSAAALGARSLPCVVSDAQGRSTFVQVALMVDAVPNQPPTADAGGRYDVDEGASVVFSGGGSDPEGGTLTFAWDLDGDGVFETPGQSPSLRADDGPSVRTVMVQVTDDGAATATATASVAVANVAPTAVFHAPAQATGVFPLSFSAPVDPSLADTAAGFTYAFDCGSGFGAYAAAATASCPVGTGTLAVGGRIRDKDGGVTDYRGSVVEDTVRDAPTFDGLCALTRSLSRKPHVAESLCRKLARAAHAKSAQQRLRHLHAYRADVRAHTGWKRSKAFRPSDGARLQALARQLERG
jgi:PKD domain